jgi:hypothetical protein
VLLEAILAKNQAQSEAKRALAKIRRTAQKIIIPQQVLEDAFFQIYENTEPSDLQLDLSRFTDLLRDMIANSTRCTPSVNEREERKDYPEVTPTAMLNLLCER